MVKIFAYIFHPKFQNSVAGFGANPGILQPMKNLLTTLIISASLFLGACGQTGPLFLPDQPDKTVDGR
ncbi:MAG: lipoprotein [Gammaproteobacteria bacterium]